MPQGPRSLSRMARLVAVATSLGVSGAGVPAYASAQPAAVPDAPGGEADEGGTTKAAILPVVVEGDEVPDADRQQLTANLVDGLERGDFEVVSPEQVVATSPNAATCKDAGCYAAIAKATGASHIVRAVVQVRDRDYQVRMALIDDAGKEVASASDACQICGVAEVGDLIDAAAATLRTKLDAMAQGPAVLVVSSEPSGAQLYIDGQLIGTTPFNDEVIAGEHVLRISMDGFITVEREVTFVEGIEQSQTFTLEKVPSRLPARPWGWVSLGAGIAGLGTAAAFAVLGQQEIEYKVAGNCDAPDADGDCPRIWNTEMIVLGSAIAGAAFTTLGVAILLNSSKRNKAPVEVEATASRRPRFGIGPGSVTIRGRF